MLIKYKAKPNAMKIASVKSEVSLKEIARRTDSHYQTIISINLGIRLTNKQRAEKIAKALNSTVEDLFFEIRP